MRAEDVGWATNRLVLGKHSGRTAFKQRLEELGIRISSQAELNDAFARFKDLADKKHEIFDEDLQALMTETETAHVSDRFTLQYLKVGSETGTKPVAQVCVSVDGIEQNAEAEGGGPVDATYSAIEKIIGSGAELLLYSVSNVTKGIDAQGEVTVRLQRGGRVVNGQGADTDIVIASAKAYINALNRLQQPFERKHPQMYETV
jgi:2-isopropylmalate synthase